MKKTIVTIIIGLIIFQKYSYSQVYRYSDNFGEGYYITENLAKLKSL